MSKPASIRGHHAPPPKLAPAGAALIALAVALPGGAIISVVAWALGF